jgi:predicted HAD superfamily hydrolase
VRKHFSALYFPNFDPHQFVPLTPYNWGYTLVGPLLVGFAQWLLEASRQDGIQRLYFLSREGQIIKSIFDCWTEGLSGPSSEYLIVSRRAVTVAGLSNFEDILEIAKPNFFGASLGSFLFQIWH